MGILSSFFASKGEKIKVFTGQGYTEEAAQFHAEQRLLAFIREEEKQKISFTIISRKIAFKKSSDLLTKCYITLNYIIKRR